MGSVKDWSGWWVVKSINRKELQMRFTRIIPAALTLPTLVLLGCSRFTEAAPQPEPLVLKTYEVPSAYASEVGAIVRHLLSPMGKEEPSRGSASLAPGGRLLVAAPAGFQEGIKEMVDSLNQHKPPPPQPVTLEAWVVVGKPADKAVESPGTKAFGVIAPALDMVMRNQGPMEFALMEKLQLSAVSGEHASTNGATVSMNCTATALQDQILADLRINPDGPAQFDTRVQLPHGRLMVLGQSGYVPHGPEQPFFADRGHVAGMSLFYILRANPGVLTVGN